MPVSLPPHSSWHLVEACQTGQGTTSSLGEGHQGTCYLETLEALFSTVFSCFTYSGCSEEGAVRGPALSRGAVPMVMEASIFQPLLSRLSSCLTSPIPESGDLVLVTLATRCARHPLLGHLLSVGLKPFPIGPVVGTALASRWAVDQRPCCWRR